MHGAAHAAEEVQDFLRAQHYRQFLRLLQRRDDILENPVLFEGDLAEESQGGDGDEDGTRSQLALVGQIDLIRPDLIGTEGFRRLLEVSCE